MTSTTDAASAERLAKALQELHDIVEPVPPPLWPPAPGWYLLAATLVLLALVAALAGWQHWRAQAYRRQAQRELTTLRRRMEAGNEPGELITALATLLRRVALHGSPREQIAALTNDAWIDYLKTSACTELNPAVAALLCHGPYAPLASIATQPTEDILAAFDYVSDWINRHRFPQQPAK